MDGAQHVQGYVGYGPIPNKQQPEPVYTGVNPQGKRISPWPENWEGPFTPCYAVTSTSFETGFPFPGPSGPPIRPPQNNNLDMARWGRETMQPRNYSNTSYFELWLRSIARWLQRGGWATTKELTRGRGVHPAIIDEESLKTAAQVEEMGKTEAVLGFGKPKDYSTFGGVLYPTYESPDYPEAKTDAELPQPKFNVGDKVRAKLQHSAGHTRQYPLYRGRVGEIVAYYGLALAKYGPPVAEGQPPQIVFQPVYQKPYADISSKGLQDILVPLYSVKFDDSDIFGFEFVERLPSNETSETAIYADMWEPYLELL
jgi:hypothetical protein